MFSGNENDVYWKQKKKTQEFFKGRENANVNA